MLTIAVINQKGGVGKTTTTVNVGAGLALRGKRVLLIDFDPQANLTSHLEWEPFNLELSTYDVLRGNVTLADAARPTNIPNLFLIPSNGDLAAAEVELTTEIGRETILKDKLAKANESGQPYDYVLIDCPPSLGLLAVNALTAADEALVPIQAEFFALQGMARFIEVQNLVQERLNPGLRLGGIVICMWRGQANLSREVRDEVQKVFGHVLFDTVIRQNVKLAEAPSSGRTIYEHAPDSNGALDFASLTLEFLRRHGEVVDEAPMPSIQPVSMPEPREMEALEPEEPEEFDPPLVAAEAAEELIEEAPDEVHDEGNDAETTAAGLVRPIEIVAGDVSEPAQETEESKEDEEIDLIEQDPEDDEESDEGFGVAIPGAHVPGTSVLESSSAGDGPQQEVTYSHSADIAFRPIHVRPFGDVRLVGDEPFEPAEPEDTGHAEIIEKELVEKESLEESLKKEEKPKRDATESLSAQGGAEAS